MNESGDSSPASVPTTGSLVDTELPAVSPLGTSPGDSGHSPEEYEPEERWVRLPLLLFLATCVSTFWAAASNWMPFDVLSFTVLTGDRSLFLNVLGQHWGNGLLYMGCVLAILLAHEMGHFLATVYYRVPASLPYFLPMPFGFIGTLGAVIALDGMRADRRQMFDIGIAGPLAGLVLALPILWIGVGRLDFTQPAHGAFTLCSPALVQIMVAVAPPPGFQPGSEVLVPAGQLNPFFMAGWLGLLVTGLNMMPLGQLDGGHVLYALVPRSARRFARGFLLFVAVYSAWSGAWTQWGLMLLLVTFMGVDHPRTANDNVPLGGFRVALGCLAWLIPVLCFPLRVLAPTTGP